MGTDGASGAANPVVARVLGEARIDLALVRTRAVTELTRVNAELTQVHCGHLVAVPISARAREPGPLADFLTDIGLDPYGHWNTLYYSADPAGAQVMDAVPYREGVEGAFDASFTAVIEQARAHWQRFVTDPAAHDEATVRGYRAALAEAIRGLAGAVHDKVYAGKANRWLHFFGRPPRDPAAAPAPPPAGLPKPPLAASAAAAAAAPAAAAPAAGSPAAGSPSAGAPAAATGSPPFDFEAARTRHEARLAAARRPVLPGLVADLVPVALCEAATRPGPLADWLLAIGADPFGPWNIVLRANTEATAQALGTPRFDPVDRGRFAAEMTALVAGLRAAWEAFAAGPGADDPALAEAMRTHMRGALEAGSAGCRAALIGPGDNLWRTKAFGGEA